MQDGVLGDHCAEQVRQLSRRDTLVLEVVDSLNARFDIIIILGLDDEVREPRRPPPEGVHSARDVATRGRGRIKQRRVLAPDEGHA